MKNVNISINSKKTPHANSVEWCEGKWNRLHEITECFDYCAAKFFDGRRNNKSAIGIPFIILDFDDGMTLDQGIEEFSSCKSLIVSTKSHQVEKDGVATDRFRVILPLNICIIDMPYYSKLIKTITRFFRSDTACTDSARYYSPNPKQLVKYSDSNEYFDIRKFDAMIHVSEVTVQKHITLPDKKEHSNLKSTVPQRIELSELLNVKVNYYQSGMESCDTLEDLITRVKPSDQAIRCHCFLNSRHEDKNPSCFIYRNKTNVYAKCVSCGIDGIIYLQGENFEY